MRRSLSLRARLNLLVALCVLPLLAVTLVTDYVNYRSAQQAAAAQALNIARSFADDVGRMLQSDIAALRTLALSPYLQRDDLHDFAGQAHGFLAMHQPDATLGLAGADRRIAFAFGNGVPVDGPLPMRSVPHTVHSAFTSGTAAVSGYYIDALTHRGGFSVDVPIKVDGKVVWELFLSPGLNALAHIAQQQRAHPGWSLIVADGDGIILDHEPNPQAFVGRPVVPELLAGMQAMPEDVLPITAPDGHRKLAAFATVPGSDWRVATIIPRAELERPLLQGAVTTLGTGAAMLVAGLLLAKAVARSIVRPIAQLQSQARLSEHDDAAPPPPTGLAETDAVAHALHAAGVARADALRRLRTFAEQLEQRVAAEVAARQDAQARAAHGERMQALGRLASGVAHDFGNVLQTIDAAANLLERRADDPVAVRRLAGLLRNAGRQGGAVTGRLLGLARSTPQMPAAFDAATLLEEMRELLATTAAAQESELPFGLEVSAPPDLPPVLANRAQLETVLLNLAANARDAMPGGGTLTLSAARADGASTMPPDLAPGGYVCLAVADTGSGMSPEVLARVTEPFFTTKPAGKGTGLGLALARGFAEQSGGALTIESAPGIGTVVRIWLPRAPA